MSKIATICSKVVSIKYYRPVLLALALFVGVAAPIFAGSSASAVAGGCPANNVCLYEHTNFGGSSLRTTILGPACVTAGSLNNRASSVVNNTVLNIIYFEGPTCNGCSFTDTPFSYRKLLWQDRYTYPCQLLAPQDNISSFRVY